MTDEIPADLIALKTQFYATEAQLAAMPDADPTEWMATHRHLAELAVQIQRHPALTEAGAQRYAVDAAASKAARAGA